jgi:magnesium transporter
MRPDAIALPPGTLKAPPDAHPSSLELMAWGASELRQPDAPSLGDVGALLDTHPVTWINVVGLGDASLIEQLGCEFDLHRLALEDTINVPQRPKAEHFGSHMYMVARMPMSGEELKTEQISIFLGDGFLITVQEKPGDCFDGIRRRIREGRQRIRSSGPDYLAYAVLDAIVDAYLPLIEALAVRVDDLEIAVTGHAGSEQITQLHETKRDLITLRRYLDPLCEMLVRLVGDEDGPMEEQTRVYLRDVLDHCKHALDLVDSHRAQAASVMDLHLAVAGQRMNEVMKVLTVIATLFIPLSFIAGLYGMNFDTNSRWNLPELGWTFGYPYALGLMTICAGVMLAYFWRKGWFK